MKGIKQIAQNSVFQSFIKEVQGMKVYKKAIKNAYSTYNLNKIQITKLNPDEIRKLKLIFSHKQQKQSDQNIWNGHQLQFFIWILVVYMYIKKKKVEQLTDQDYEFFCYATSKSQNLLKYQSKAIVTLQEAQEWTQNQNNTLKQILLSQQYKQNGDWTLIARQLFNRGNREVARTAKQCRQRWNNYIDPNKKKGRWSLEEDHFLINYVRKFGKKWSEVSREMQNTRNQHMVKNRFNSLLKKKAKNLKKSLKEEQLVKILLTQLTEQFQEQKKNKRQEKIKQKDQQISSKDKKISNQDKQQPLNHIPHIEKQYSNIFTSNIAENSKNFTEMANLNGSIDFMKKKTSFFDELIKQESDVLRVSQDRFTPTYNIFLNSPYVPINSNLQNPTPTAPFRSLASSPESFVNSMKIFDGYESEVLKDCVQKKSQQYFQK